MPVFTMFLPASFILIPSAGKGLISWHGRYNKHFHHDDAREPDHGMVCAKITLTARGGSAIREDDTYG
jgi:hypothetical protein